MPPQPAPVLLHRFLGLGVIALAAVFMAMNYATRGPLITPVEDDGFSPTLAYAMSGIAVVIAVFALVILKPKVPERQPGQPVEAYWGRPEVMQAVIRVWFLMESAAMLTVVGYGLTGLPIVLIAMGLSIAAFWVTGPNAFARA